MSKKYSIIKIILFAFILSVTFMGYDAFTEQGVSIVSAATTTTTKSNEISCKKTRYVTASSLNVRKSANAKSKKVTTIEYRTKVTVIATIKNSSWVKIKLSDKTVGYVNSKYLSSKKPAKKSNGGSTNNSGDVETPSRPPQSPDDMPDGHA